MARLVPFTSLCFLVVIVFVLFFCSAYVIRLFGLCSRLLNPALDASPLKISTHLQWIFTIMITACLEFISLTESYYSWIGCYCSVIYGWLVLIYHFFMLFFLWMLVVVGDYTWPNNKCFTCVVMDNCQPTWSRPSQCVWSKCWITSWYFKRLWAWN